MSFLESARLLAEKGFYVFPLVPNTKVPAIKDFANKATRDLEQISGWASDCPDYNVGIYTGRYNGEGECLVGLDVDNKGDKKGSESLFKLELEGWEFPTTFTQVTPTEGRHLIYRSKQPVGLSAGRLGEGLDIRSVGGYLVGSGSTLDGKRYYHFEFEVSPAPAELIAACNKPRAPKEIVVDVEVSQTRAIPRGVEFLESLPEIGQGSRNAEGFATACRLKDFGLTEENCFILMREHWKCEPLLDDEELKNVIHNAFSYGRNDVGVLAPETQFTEINVEKAVGSPIEEINKEFAFVTNGGAASVLWETKDLHGQFRLQHLSVQAFHQKLAPITMSYGEKTVAVSQRWIKSKDRRTYDGLVFEPGREVPKNFYNLWRGFAVEPKSTGSPKAISAFNDFLNHVRENVCDNEPRLFDYIMTYFAHLVQKPSEKPLVALVFRGGKGVGKNAFIDRIGDLFGGHYLIASDPRYLVGNFNSHLENCLLFTLDEAFWSADKKAEGRLKDLITGNSHLIERKGFEPYKVRNCTRVVILGNEDWLVPASHDERRFAVFQVGSGKKQNREYFKNIRLGFAEGGASLLLNYLLNYDISKVDINEAPMTAALEEQKDESLPAFFQYWKACLDYGEIRHSDFAGSWPTEASTDQLRIAFKRYCKDRGIRSWTEDDAGIGKFLKRCCSKIKKLRKRSDGGRVYCYQLPSLAICRQQWDTFIGHKTRWEFPSEEEKLD